MTAQEQKFLTLLDNLSEVLRNFRECNDYTKNKSEEKQNELAVICEQLLQARKIFNCISAVASSRKTHAGAGEVYSALISTGTADQAYIYTKQLVKRLERELKEKQNGDK